MKTGSWERVDRFVSRFSMAQTKRDLPARDREYNDLLSYNYIFVKRTATVGSK